MSNVFDTPKFGRKEKYQISSSINQTASIEMATSETKESRSESKFNNGSTNQYKAMKILIIALFLVILLLTTAIIWILVTKTSPTDGKVGTLEGTKEPDENYFPVERKAGTTVNIPTTRTTRIINPKPTRTSTSSSTAATITTVSYDDYDGSNEEDRSAHASTITSSVSLIPHTTDDDELTFAHSTSAKPEETTTLTGHEVDIRPIFEYDDISSTMESSTEVSTHSSFGTTVVVDETTKHEEIARKGFFPVKMWHTEEYSTTDGSSSLGETHFSSEGENSTTTTFYSSTPLESSSTTVDHLAHSFPSFEGSESTVGSIETTSPLPEVTVLKERIKQELTSVTTEFSTVTSSSETVYSISTLSTVDDQLVTNHSNATTAWTRFTPTVVVEGESYDYVVGQATSDSQPTYDTDRTEASTVSLNSLGTTLTGETTTMSILHEETMETCSTKYCKRISSVMLASMNEENDPCNNFYDYACGGVGRLDEFVQLLPVNVEGDATRRISKALENTTTESPQSFQLLKQFYDLCKEPTKNSNETTRLKEIRQAVAEVGQFYDPQLTTSSNLDLTALFASLIKYSHNPIFDVLLDVNPNISSKFALKIGPTHYPSLLSPAELVPEKCTSILNPTNIKDPDLSDIYNQYGKCKEDYKDILDRMEDAMYNLEVFSEMDEESRKQNITAIRFVVDVDILSAIRTHLPKEGELRRILISKEFQEFSVQDLSNEFPGVEWDRLFREILGSDVPSDEKVQVYTPRYLKSILKSLLKNDPVMVHNGLLALFASDLYNHLVVLSNEGRSSVCQKMATTLMEDVASSLFLSTFKEEELRQTERELHSIFDALKWTLTKKVEGNSKMTMSARESVVNKIHSMKGDFHNAIDHFGDPSNLESTWKGFDLEESFASSTLKLMKKYRQTMYSLKDADPRTSTTIWSFHTSPLRSSGQAIYFLNQVLLPFGAVSGGQLYGNHYPLYVNMGKIGYLIAHEMMHHFDEIGIRYGNVTTIPEYQTSLECLRDNIPLKKKPFIEREDSSVIYQLNRNLIFNEIFSDVSGIELAFMAYQEQRESSQVKMEVLPRMNLTDSQIFFLSAAQLYCTEESLANSALTLGRSEHLPGQLRVEYLIKQSKEFRKVFNCGSNTNQCSVFPFV